MCKRAASRTLARLMLLAFAMSIPGANIRAQNLFELRGADTKYRYADWLYVLPNSATIDVFYDGVPGSNEFNFGGGYGIKARKLTVSPLIYFVIGKEASQRGLRMGILVTFDKGGWKLISYLSHFAPLSGGVTRYQSLDTLDLTRALGKRWDVGVQSGFFHCQGMWNPQVGPLARFNDQFGSWAASYRFGPQKEFRLVRVFAF